MKLEALEVKALESLERSSDDEVELDKVVYCDC